MKRKEFNLDTIRNFEFESRKAAKKAIKEVFGDDPDECGYIVDIFVRGDKFVVSYFNSES